MESYPELLGIYPFQATENGTNNGVVDMKVGSCNTQITIIYMTSMLRLNNLPFGKRWSIGFEFVFLTVPSYLTTLSLTKWTP